MNALLRLEGLTAGYGGAVAVDGVSLAVAPGETVALLGANGAGKSTLMKAVLGLVPSRGTVMIAGTDATRLPTHRRASLGLGYVPEGRRVFPGMSVHDTLDAAGPSSGTERRAAMERVYALFPDLRTKAGDTAWRLSGGQQQMLAIARALMGSPRLLLLDEPSLGLSPRLSSDVFAAVSAIAATGTAVLLADQSTARALSVAGRAILLRQGRILYDGSSAHVTPDRLTAAFLGAP